MFYFARFCKIHKMFACPVFTVTSGAKTRYKSLQKQRFYYFIKSTMIIPVSFFHIFYMHKHCKNFKTIIIKTKQRSYSDVVNSSFKRIIYLHLNDCQDQILHPQYEVFCKFPEISDTYPVHASFILLKPLTLIGARRDIHIYSFYLISFVIRTTNCFNHTNIIICIFFRRRHFPSTHQNTFMYSF